MSPLSWLLDFVNDMTESIARLRRLSPVMDLELNIFKSVGCCNLLESDRKQYESYLEEPVI